MLENIIELNQKVEDIRMNIISIALISFITIIFANPTAWQDDPSGGSPMPFFLVIIGLIFIFIWLKSEL